MNAVALAHVTNALGNAPLMDAPGVGRGAFPVAALLAGGAVVALCLAYRRLKRATELEDAEAVLRAECEREARAYQESTKRSAD